MVSFSLKMVPFGQIGSIKKFQIFSPPPIPFPQDTWKRDAHESGGNSDIPIFLVTLDPAQKCPTMLGPAWLLCILLVPAGE